ncbi:excinuclease ABC subunit UvrA [Ignavibacteria bacterium]|nr:excinuclease ABC subunit UvrA [Bacteroidota bacterium]
MPSNEYEPQELSEIVVSGAREHNLKNISLNIPREKLVVITGLSGSGKSSLAFDTLYAEGQRRYVECLSPYARQFLGMMKKPDVDNIEGLSPAISIEQKSVGKNPRSTVGTVTEIWDYIRLLYAKTGTQFCVDCHIPVQSQSFEQIIETLGAEYAGRRVQILAPAIKGRKGHYKELFEKFRRQGYSKARIDGTITEIEHGLQLSRYKAHNIEIVIDRLTIGPKQDERVAESVETALRLGENTIVILWEDGEVWRERLFSAANSCGNCGKAYEPLSPNSFSFNSPFGACKKCDGLGYANNFDIKKIIPANNFSVEDGGIAILGKKRKMWAWDQLSQFARRAGMDLNIPISEMENKDLQTILLGSKKQKTEIQYVTASGRVYVAETSFQGILPMFRKHYDETGSSDIRENYEQYMSPQVCESCNGGRLSQESLSVFIHEKNIHDISSLDITAAAHYFAELNKYLTERENILAKLILREINARLSFLINVGLHYVALGRSARSLSGGESQRIRLASQIGSQLVGVTYILDEPSIGLHQHDNHKLIKSLKNLRDLGNSVIVVEHDRDMIESADYLIDVGPRAGVHGGEICFAGEPQALFSEEKTRLSSITAKYLTGDENIDIPKKRRQGNGKQIVLSGARGNNLKNVNFCLPLGAFVCVTGMSGSGKSTLINDTLFPIISRHFANSTVIPLPYDSISGLENIDKVIEIDQTPIGRTPRSNPVTYTGVFTQIRDFYAQMPEAKARGYLQGRFSFNVKGGRCEDCEGGGINRIEMNYLPDVYVTCETCAGKRYNSETLQVHYKGKSIADTLEMSIEEATEFFAEIPKIRVKLQTLLDVGLGYIKLGQQAPTLSGGEAQRVKLAAELSRVQTGKTLYLLDEPTTGLHFEDVRVLLRLLGSLVDKGNTVIVIEHNLDVVKFADWIIDLGPEGGAAGGEIVAEGTPETIVKKGSGYTAKYLKKEFKR